MARRVPRQNITPQEVRKLQIKKEAGKYSFGATPTYIYPIDEDSEADYVYVPFAFNKKYSRPTRKDFRSVNYHFEGKLRDKQKQVQSEAVEHLNRYASILVACHPGWGKTCLGINIASKIKLPTLILAHRVVLINQWKESIHKFCPGASVQILEPSSVMIQADFYIMNPTNIPKRNRDFYRGIGFLIVDECHLIMAEKMSESMLYICPRYVLGLSATPYRVDGLNDLLDLYFGKRKIERKLWHRHTVYMIDSGFTPEMEETKNGKVNWNTVLNSQADDLQRNELIVDLVKFFPKRVFLILCKRVIQAKNLVNRLEQEGEDVTSLVGTQQHYGHDKRILIGTTNKCGVGFDHPKLNSLILASDIEQYFVQFLGRIFRTQNVEPLIFDIVDNNPILKKHARTRKSVYIEHGGVIKSFNRMYPEFMELHARK